MEANFDILVRGLRGDVDAAQATLRLTRELNLDAQHVQDVLHGDQVLRRAVPGPEARRLVAQLQWAGLQAELRSCPPAFALPWSQPESSADIPDVPVTDQDFESLLIRSPSQWSTEAPASPPQRLLHFEPTRVEVDERPWDPRCDSDFELPPFPEAPNFEPPPRPPRAELERPLTPLPAPDARAEARHTSTVPAAQTPVMIDDLFLASEPTSSVPVAPAVDSAPSPAPTRATMPGLGFNRRSAAEMARVGSVPDLLKAPAQPRRVVAATPVMARPTSTLAPSEAAPGEMQAFLTWAAANGLPAGEPAFLDGTRRFFEAAPDGLPTAAVIDAVVWAEESAGAAQQLVRTLRRVGSALATFESSGSQPAARATSTPRPGQMSVDELRGVIAGCIHKVYRRTTRTPPRVAECKSVVEVAPLCPASELGVRRGDVVVSVNMSPAITYDPDAKYREGPVEWEFYRPETKELIQARTNGVPMGLRLCPTAAAAQAGYKLDCNALLLLWELGEHRAVHDRCLPMVEAADEPNIPEYALLGAALVELGEVGQGLAILEDYLERYAQCWTLGFRALAYYYFAQHLQSTDPEKATRLALLAYEDYRCERTIALVETLAHRRPPLRRKLWTGRRFPVQYDLEIEGTTARRALTSSLDALPAGRLHMVCGLSGWRINGPYGVFMNYYLRCTRTLPQFFHSLHVITAATASGADCQYRGEEHAQNNGLEFDVLLDRENEVFNAFDVHYTPYVVAVDERGIVRGENVRYDIELWNTLVDCTSGLGDR